MSVPFSTMSFRIPRGFANLLEGLTREILREQPEDIHLFGAKYFEQQLKLREETSFDPSEWGAALEDRFYNNGALQENVTGDLSKAQAATTIQAAVRGHLARGKVKMLREANEENYGENILEPSMEDPQQYEQQSSDHQGESLEEEEAISESATLVEREEQEPSAPPGSGTIHEIYASEEIHLGEIEKTQDAYGSENEEVTEEAAPEHGVDDGEQRVEESSSTGNPEMQPAAELDVDEKEKEAEIVQNGEDLGNLTEQSYDESNLPPEILQEDPDEHIESLQEHPDNETDSSRLQDNGLENSEEKNETSRKQQDEALDIPLDDPDANAAAAKIQAGFRGHMTRKKMKTGEKDLKSKECKGASSTGGANEGD